MRGVPSSDVCPNGLQRRRQLLADCASGVAGGARLHFHYNYCYYYCASIRSSPPAELFRAEVPTPRGVGLLLLRATTAQANQRAQILCIYRSGKCIDWFGWIFKRRRVTAVGGKATPSPRDFITFDRRTKEAGWLSESSAEQMFSL
ncbi:hypothetical protein GPALN_012475 [Globodera pallida]|nr:hypothetical protein GPALN_012475 [Globodera pallida]